MMGWQTFWMIVLIFGMLVFAVLAVVVTFTAFRDVREMFKKIEDQHEELE